jgi:glycosyltransferase involved in cell wall biosynthesis
MILCGVRLVVTGSRMNITFVLPHAGLSGGIRVVAVYADRLQKRGHRVRVVSQPPGPISVERKVKSLLKGRGWPTVAKGSPFFADIGIEHRVLDAVRPVVESDVADADVVIATWWETAEWVSRLPMSKGRKYYLVQDHEIFPRLPIERVKSTYLLPLKKVAVSSWLAKVLSREYGCSDISIVGNGVDTFQFYAKERTKRPQPTVGFVYDPSPRKNSMTAIEVLRQIKATLPDTRAVIFGSARPPDGTISRSWMQFHFRPSQDSIPHLYGQCDVWLFTSLSEGFGLPILEAMACRTPVVGSSAGAAPDLIKGKNGFLVENRAEAFAEKVAEILTMSNDQWRSLSDAAHATAQEHSWDDATEKFERVLRG